MLWVKFAEVIYQSAFMSSIIEFQNNWIQYNSVRPTVRGYRNFRIHLFDSITSSNVQYSRTHSLYKFVPRLLRIFPRNSEASFFVRKDVLSTSDSDFVSTPEKKICRSHRCTCHWQTSLQDYRKPTIAKCVWINKSSKSTAKGCSINALSRGI